jgi:zinc protease
MTIGNRADIERVPIHSLKRFYEKYYRVDNVMVVVAGRFEADKALGLVEKYFGDLEPPQVALEPTYTEEPVQDGERIVYLRRTGDVKLVGVGYHIPSAAHPDSAAIDVLSLVMGLRPSGRLYKNLVETKLATSVSASADSGHDPGMLLSFAEVPETGDEQKTLEAILSTLEDSGQGEFSEEEVQRGVAELLKRREDLLTDTSGLAIELSEWAAYGDWRLFFLHRDRLEKVTTSDVRRVAAEYLLPSNRTVGVFIPTDEPVRARVPQSPAVEHMVADYKGRAAVSEGEVFDIDPDFIESRVTRGQLSSGLKYALLPKKTKGEKVLLSLILRFGSATSLADARHNDASDLLAELMSRGTENHSYQQIQDRLRELKTNLSSRSSTGEASFRLESRREQFGDALELLREILREPNFPAAEFDIIRDQRLTRLENQKSDPQALAVQNLMRRLMPYPKGDVRYVATAEEQIEQLQSLNSQDVETLYRQFMNGQHGELVIVGDFDPEQVLPVLESMLGNWTTDEAYEHIDVSIEKPIDSDQVVIETPDKQNAVFVRGVVIPIRDDDPAYEAMFVGNNILGGGALSNRLASRIRQKDGLSYGVGSQFSAESLDDRGTFMTFAIMNPANRDRVHAACDEEFARILESGVTPEELEKAKSGLVEQMRAGRGQDDALVSILLKQALTGRTMDFVKAREAKILGLTKDMVDQAVRTMVDREHMVTVVAGDFDGKTQAESTESSKAGGSK